jgi:hypothetical protein
LGFFGVNLIIASMEHLSKEKSNQTRLPGAKYFNINGHHSPRNLETKRQRRMLTATLKPHESDTRK